MQHRTYRSCSPRGPDNDNGFTLMEILIAIAMVAILAAMALPSFRSFALNQRAIALANELLADVAHARMEALRRGGRAELVPSASGWSGGWEVAAIDRAMEEPQRVALGSRTFTDPEQNIDTAALGLEFDGTGALAVPSGGVTFVICLGRGAIRKARSVVVAASGLAEVRGYDPANCG